MKNIVFAIGWEIFGWEVWPFRNVGYENISLKKGDRKSNRHYFFQESNLSKKCDGYFWIPGLSMICELSNCDARQFSKATVFATASKLCAVFSKTRF
jgi:hypothetical protein